MGYVLLSDRLHSCPATMKAGLEAVGLYAMSLSYCARERTTCVPPSWVNEMPHGRRAKRRLLEVGLWQATAEGFEPQLVERETIPLARIKHTAQTRQPIPASLRRFIFDRDDGVCQLCGQPVEEAFHVDHILPWSLGGPTVKTNLQLAHPTCNIRKGNRV